MAIFNLDDTAENQDWTKARKFDLPLGDRQFLEFQLGLSNNPVQRQQRLVQLAQLPIANDAAPKWLLAELDQAMRTAMLKGDYVGHPFRGNQWMDASGVSRGGAGSSPDQDRQAYEMRQAGQTWEAIAASLGYANGGAVRRLAMRHEDRLRTEGVRADPVTPPPEPPTPQTSPQTGYVNGLRPASTDQNVAAQEGRPLAGWVEFSPAIQARLDARDRWAERNAQFEAEAVAMREEAIKTMSDADSKSLLRMDERYLVEWAAERDAAFAQRLKNHRAELPSIDVNELVVDMRDELIVAAGFRPRSESEKAELRAAVNLLDDYSESALRRTEERAAAKERLAGEQLKLFYFKEGREGKGGRMRSGEVTEQVRARRYGAEEAAKAEFERQLLVKYDIKGLIAQGYTQQQIGEIYETAYGVAADRTYTPTFLAVTRGGALTAAEIRPQQLEAVAELEGPLKTSNITITMPPRVLAQVLNDGRYKTQFETRRSGGLNDPQARSKEEADRFGYPPHMKPEFRPVYGMVELGGVQAPSERDNLQYGSAVVVLKSETRERTTFTVGDSLSNIRPSAPVMNPRAQPAVVGVDRGSVERRSVPRENLSKLYLEAQIHGGVRTSDIASVIFQVGAEIVGTSTRDEGRIIGTTKPPSRSVLAALDKAGIPYQIITKPEDIVQPVVKRAWRRFLPWVMLKGDYVGHPFRGNQWVDASGAPRGGAGADVGADLGPLHLRGVATVEEAIAQGRPLAMLRPETYSPKVRELVDANTQARDLLGQMMTEAEADGGDGTSVLSDPRFAVLETILVLTAVEAGRQMALEYALALGFETVADPPRSSYGTIISEEFAYEDQSRNEDGRLIRSEESIDANEAVNLNRILNSITLPTVILEKSDDGEVTVRFAKYESVSAGATRSGYEYGDKVDAATLMGAKFFRETADEAGTPARDMDTFALARGEQAGAMGRELVRQAAQDLGITMPAFRPPVHVTAAPLAEKLKAQGEYDVQDKIGTMLEHVQDVARGFTMYGTALSTEAAGRRTDGDNMKPVMLAQQAADLPPDTKVSVTVPANKVAAILKDGRLKNQFETGTSKGLNLPRVRESAEAFQFGLPQGTNPATRPIYGMMESGGAAMPSSARGNEQYGTVTLVLKDAVRDRTTFTKEDSLNRQGDPVPVKDAGITLSAREPVTRAEFDRRAAQEFSGSGYYEAQIHGGVRTSDIEKVIIDTSTYKDYEWTTVQPSATLIRTLTKAGIPFEIRAGKQVKGDVGKARAVRFEMSVVIKGDYVGHPFRGNQWTDASGASRAGAGSAADDVATQLDGLIRAQEAAHAKESMHVYGEGQDGYLRESNKLIFGAFDLRDGETVYDAAVKLVETKVAEGIYSEFSDDNVHLNLEMFVRSEADRKAAARYVQDVGSDGPSGIGKGATGVNQQLRRGTVTAFARQVDDSMLISNQPVAGFRGASLPQSVVDQLTVGAVYREKGFMSIADDRGTATFYADARSKDNLGGPTARTVIFRMLLPTGTRANPMARGETVIARDSSVRVTAVREVNDPERGSIVEVDAVVEQ